MKTETDLSRRRLLATGSGAIAAAGLGGVARVTAQTSPSAPPSAPAKLPAYVAWKDADTLIIHTPTTIETKRTAFGTGAITPGERLYIRNNIAAPDPSIVANRDAWQLAVEGTNDSAWDWDVVTGRIFHDERWTRMLGYDPGELESTNAASPHSAIL